MRRLEKLNIRGRGVKFVPRKMFSDIKSYFSLVLLDSRGQILNRDDLFHSGKETL